MLRNNHNEMNIISNNIRTINCENYMKKAENDVPCIDSATRNVNKFAENINRMTVTSLLFEDYGNNRNAP